MPFHQRASRYSCKLMTEVLAMKIVLVALAGMSDLDRSCQIVQPCLGLLACSVMPRSRRGSTARTLLAWLANPATQVLGPKDTWHVHRLVLCNFATGLELLQVERSRTASGRSRSRQGRSRRNALVPNGTKVTRHPKSRTTTQSRPPVSKPPCRLHFVRSPE